MRSTLHRHLLAVVLPVASLLGLTGCDDATDLMSSDAAIGDESVPESDAGSLDGAPPPTDAGPPDALDQPDAAPQDALVSIPDEFLEASVPLSDVGVEPFDTSPPDGGVPPKDAVVPGADTLTADAVAPTVADGEAPDAAGPDAAAPDAALPDAATPDAARNPVDTDGDGVPDGDDRCPEIADDGADVDQDGLGDACDPCPEDVSDDTDRDGLCAEDDNCLDVSNPDQANLDGDGEGDLCDADDDGDGVVDGDDACPSAADPEQFDSDGDGLGDACDPPTCDDGIADGHETDRDCGGPECPACGDDAACISLEDCASSVCLDGFCQAPTCEDRSRNGDEADVDCGGPDCFPCPPDATCGEDGDCDADFCLDGLCLGPHCDDRRTNGEETDVDCGGSDCAPCPPGGVCVADSDCDDSNPCTDDACVDAVCSSLASPPAWRAVLLASDLSGVSHAEALAADPVTGTLYARSQQNPSGTHIQLIRVTLDGVVTRLTTLANLRSSNNSGLGVDSTGELLFADETWNNRGRIAALSPQTLAVRTVFATPWVLNPNSTGAGQIRFAPDVDHPDRLHYFDGTRARVYTLDRGVVPNTNNVLFDASAGRADATHPNVASDLRYDAGRHTLLLLDPVRGALTEIDPLDGHTTPWGELGAGFNRLAGHAALQSVFASNGNEIIEVTAAGPVVRPVVPLAGVRDLAVGPNPARPGGISIWALSQSEDAVYELRLENEACFLVPTCEDARQNGDETGVDCGGPCPECALAEPCVSALDCDDADLCTADTCAAGACVHALEPALCPEVDLDGDGLLNGVEVALALDPLDADSDDDGLSDGLEDGDQDTITNLDETSGGLPVDTDADGTLDLLDADSDADRIPDRVEAGDALRQTPPVDSDDDRTPDFQDDDSDGDRLPDLTEAVEADPDGDGVRPSLDLDSDGDGRGDGAEGAEDRDGDGILDFLDPQDLRVYSAHDVVARECEGQSQDGLCSGQLFVDIVFPVPFDQPPHVLVSAENVSSQGGCVGGATDKVVAYPANITREGFRLYAYGSPWAGNCGIYNGWASQASAGYLAVEADGQAQSGHNVLGIDCDGAIGNGGGGLCNGAFYADIVFPTPYAAPPHVLAVAENVSNQGGCVGGATDQIVARAVNITERGFRLYIHGSPMGSCGAEEGFASRASAGYLVLPQGPQRVSGHDLAPVRCLGEYAGGLCGSDFVEDVAFGQALISVPHVLTAAEVVSAQGGCVGGATDKLSVFPQAMTAEGFVLHARGSPETGSCGAFDAFGTLARAGFIALQ